MGTVICITSTDSDPNRLTYYQRRAWANRQVQTGTISDTWAAGGGRFGEGTAPNISFSAAFLEVETRISAFECAFADATGAVGAGGLKVQLGLFSASPVNRLPIAYIPNTETVPISFSDAASAYNGLMTNYGYRFPITPIVLLPGWYLLCVLVNLQAVGGGGRIACDNPRFPAAFATGLGPIVLDRNLNFVPTVAVAPGPGAISGLNIADLTKFSAAPAYRQANIAWVAVCDPI